MCQWEDNYDEDDDTVTSDTEVFYKDAETTRASVTTNEDGYEVRTFEVDDEHGVNYVNVDQGTIEVDTHRFDHDETYDRDDWDVTITLTKKSKTEPVRAQHPAGTLVRGREVGHYIKQQDGHWRFLIDDRRTWSVDEDEIGGQVHEYIDDEYVQRLGSVVYSPAAA